MKHIYKDMKTYVTIHGALSTPVGRRNDVDLMLGP